MSVSLNCCAVLTSQALQVYFLVWPFIEVCDLPDPEASYLWQEEGKGFLFSPNPRLYLWTTEAQALQVWPWPRAFYSGPQLLWETHAFHPQLRLLSLSSPTPLPLFHGQQVC